VVQEVKVVGGAAKKVKIIGGLICLLGFVLMLIWPFCFLVFGIGLFVFIAGRFVE
jgi:flagellar biogenesis protein FliO